MADIDNDPFAKYVAKPAAPAADAAAAAPGADSDPFGKYTSPDYKAPRSAMQQVGPRLNDQALQLAKGLIGVPETFVGLGNLVSEGGVGKLAEQAGFHPKDWKAALDKQISPEGQQANRNLAEAKGFVPTVVAGLQNPSAVVSQAVESAPTIVSGGLVSRGLMKAIPSLAAKAEGAVAAGAIGEGATAAGQNAEQVRQEDPNGTLTPGQSAILAASGALTGIIGMGAGQLANKLGIGELSTMMAAGRLGAVGEQAIATGARKGIARKIGEGALVEGVGQELPQSYQEQVAQNLAQGKPWDEGAAEAGAQGMLAGGLMGAVAGPLHGHEEHAPAAAPPAEPPGPLTAAAAKLAPAGRQQFPFGSLDLAQKQADSFTSESGIPHQAVPHPTVPGKFAAVPVAIDGADDLFVKEAERQGVDPAAAQLATHGEGAARLMTDLLAKHPDVTAQQWSDPATRAQLAAAYLKQDIDALGEALGRAPTPAETYIGRRLGTGPAADMLSVPDSERAATPVESFIPDPAVAARLGVAGLAVGPAIDVLTQQADATLATLKGNGNGNLGTKVPAAGSAAAGADGGAAVGNAAGSGPVAGGPAGGTGAVATGTPAAPGAAATGPDGAGAVAAPSPRVQVGPTPDGYQNTNAQRHRDSADALGLTDTIERLFGDGLTVNQVVGQIQDKAPGVLPADLPNMVNGVRGTLGIPAPISPEGKGAFDAWRKEYKARGQQGAQQGDMFSDVPDFPAGPTNAGAAKVTPEAVQPKNPLDEAAHQSSNSPLNTLAPATQAQIDADNYKLGRTTLFGMPVGIENPKGSTRRSKAKDSDNPWESLMTAHYGRFTGTKGADGDPVDVFIGDNPDSGKAFVIDQVNPKTGQFDEHKVIAGVNSEAEARQLYQDNYHAGWTGAKAVTEVTPDQLRYWLQNGDTSGEFAAPATVKQALTVAPSEATPTGTTTPEPAADAKPKLNIYGLPVGVTFASKPEAVTAADLKKGDWIIVDGAPLLVVDHPKAGADGKIEVSLDSSRGTTTIAVAPTTKVQRKVIEAAKPAAADTPATPDTPAAALPAWHDSPFAPRIQAMVDQLNAAGDAGYAKSISGGSALDAKNGKLAEENVAFRENNVRQRLATLATKDKPAAPVAIEPETAESLGQKINTLPALPRAIGDAAVARWNEIAPKLAALGFKDGEVDARHSPEAQALQKQLKDISNALNGMAPRRYAQERGHKNLNPDAVARDEDFASQVLGIDTRAHPGIDASKQITLGQGVKAPALPLDQANTDLSLNDKAAAARADQLEQARTALHAHLGDAGDLFKMDGVRHAKARQDVMSALMGTPVEKKAASVDALRAELYRRIGITKGNALTQELAFQRWYKDGGLIDVPAEGAEKFVASVPFADYKVGDTVQVEGRTWKVDKVGAGLDISTVDAGEPRRMWVSVDTPPSTLTAPAGKYKSGDFLTLDGRKWEVSSVTGNEMNIVTAQDDKGKHRREIVKIAQDDATATAPEHARNEGKPLDPDNKFVPTASDVTEDASISPGVELLTMDVADFAKITNEFAALFADPDEYVQTDKRVDPATILHAPEPVEAGKGKWTMAPSKATLAALKKASWSAAEGAPDKPLITMVETTDERSVKEGKRHFNITSNYTNRYDSTPMTFGAVIAGEQRDSPDGRDAGRVGSKDGLPAGVAEMKAMWLELESAILTQDKWTDHAIDQAENRRIHSANSQKVILSLFDLSGEWGQPWADAGYNVIPVDIQNGMDVHDLNADYLYNELGIEGDIHGILAATPCTDFASSGAKHFAAKDADGRTEASKELVFATLSLIENLRPKFWVLENPVGRIANLTGLPKARMSFDQWHFGHAFTKKTMLWGNFQTDLPLSPVDPVLGSKMHSKYGGKSQATKNARSETSQGFAKAFFMANNYADLSPAKRLAGDYPEASGAVAAALKAGVPEKRIRELMEETYDNYDYEEARNALIEEVAGLKDRATEDEDDDGEAARAAAEAAAGPKPATIDNPLKFYSGMSRPGDFTKLFAEHRNVGITVGELSTVSTPKIAAAMAASNGYLFVDSGAFPIYKRNERAFVQALNANAVEEIQDEQVLSFDTILQRYAALQNHINVADDSGETVERAFFVMPDVVGRQDESLRLVGQYARQIKAFGVQNAIVPLQAGELTLTQAYESMMLELAMDPDHDISPIIGIPSAVEAVSNEQLQALLEKHGGNIFGLHILGAVSDARLAPRLAVIRAAGFDGHVSADANRLRALMYGERSRGAAWDALLAESEPAQGRIETGQAEPALAKEVSRFAGKYGKGMTQPNAEMAANNRAKADPAHDYTVEESATLPGKYEVVGREKAPAAGDKPGLKKMQDAKAEKDAAKDAPAEAGQRSGTVGIDTLIERAEARLAEQRALQNAAVKDGNGNEWVYDKKIATIEAELADYQRARAELRAEQPAAGLSDNGSAPAERATIAARYATALMRDGVSDAVKDFHLRFADDLLAKDAFALKWITNGMNDKAKKVFTEFTGVKLPRAQGASWEALKQWAGVTPAQEAAVEAKAEAARAAKQQTRDDEAAENDAELQRFQVSTTDTTKISGKQVVDNHIADGYNAIENISTTPIPRYVLVNKELGRFYPLDKIGRKYAEVALRRLGKSAVAADTDGESLVSVEQAATDQAEHERELADAKAKGQTVASDKDLDHLFGKDKAASDEQSQEDADSAMFDDLLAEGMAERGMTTPAAAPAPAARAPRAPKAAGAAPARNPAAKPPRTAGQAGASAVKNVAQGLTDAIDALGALFGGKGTLGSGPVFNEDTYKQAKPLFDSAVGHLAEAGADLRDMMRAVINMVLDKFGATTANGMKPYVLRYIADARNTIAEQGGSDNTINADNTKDDNGTRPEISDLGAPGVGEAGGTVADGQPAGTRPAGQLGEQPAADDGAAGGAQGGAAVGARSDRPDDPGGKGVPALGDGSDGRNGTSGTGLVDAGTGVGGPAVGPARANYHIGDHEQLIGGTPKVRFAKNRAAIEAFRSITEEGRAPVKADLDAMAAYIGWGSFGQELFKGTWERAAPKEGWTGEDAWLRGHLGQQEWESAQRSIINAHYTDPVTVNTMWNMVRALGFTGGRVLEPSIGIGNFFAMMPLDLAEKSELTGIEMDSLSGGMAKELYPNANIQIKPYQDSKTVDGFYDLVIGNWPFAKDGPSDRRYMKLNPSLHDFFFLKALDQTRAGGLVVGITSAGTMDKKGRATRMEIAKKAELVAAFRLPAGAFEKYAGTFVTTDLIVLRKRATPWQGIESWVELGKTTVPAGETIEVNSYFLQHPEHVLGTLNFGRGLNGRPAMLVERPADLMARLAQLPGKMPADTYQPAQDRKQVSYLTNNTADREGSVTFADGKLYVVRGERLMPLADEFNYKLKDPAKTAAREAQIGKLIAMRKAYGALVTAERAADDNTEALRKDLNRQYLAFKKAYGSLEASEGMGILRRVKDPFYAALASLEIDGKPARILKEATLRGRKKLANPSVRDAFVMARNESMDVDLGTIAKLAGQTEAQVTAELEKADAIYKTPAGNYEVADIYLSGNVRRKLREAKDAQANAPAGEVGTDFARNIAALGKVLPKTVPYFKIEAKLGAPWIKAEHYQGYVARLLGLTRDEDKANVEVRMVNGSWKIKFTDKGLNNRPEATTQWGTGYPGARLDKMLTAAMNNRSITVKYKDENGAMQVDEAATKEVSEKLVKLREEFGNWVWKDAERRVWLEENYNEVMNAIATPNFDGSFLDFNGMTLRRGNDPFSLRKHQVDAIWRGLVNGRGLYAHEVGTGKTYTMAGLAVESRRYGLAKKPLIFAHNANSASVAKEFNDMYPAARVLYLDNLAPADLDVRMRQIANDDWDAVVVPHSLISRFALTAKTLNEIAAEDIAAMEQEAIDAAADDNVTLDLAMMDDEDAMKKVRSATAKELVKARNKIIKSINDMALKSSKEDAVSFEDLGVDMIIVDEAHEFKKPPVATKMKMRGLNTGTSNMSIALRFLTDYVKRGNNGRGIHLFTGTPITNTLTELYNMMRYVMDDVMARDGIKDWDSWFNTFADSNTDVELTAAGEYEAVTRLASFVNTAELRRISGEFMDIVFADDMPEFKPRPTASGKILTDELNAAEREELLNGRSENPVGRPYKQIIVDVAPLGMEQRKMLDNFKALAKQFKNASKKDRRDMMLSGHPASPLLVETGAANAGMDPRLVDMNARDESNSKVNRVARNVAALYHEDARATQVVFLERGFADEGSKTKTNANGTKTVTKVRKFNLVKDMVAKMVAAGVKESEIAVVDGSVSKEKRKQIADAMNQSKIRVVIGLTKTLGVGVNMQENLRAMHHVDAPWMPGELEQRNGRGWRQGNKWNTVREYRYITERLDGRRWQVLAVKDRFIKLFLKADENTRIIDGDAVDMEEGAGGGDLAATLSEAAGDPRVLVREKLKADIEKLENRERQHTYALTDAANAMRHLSEENAHMAAKLPKVQADSAQYEAGRGNFSATIGDKQYTERGAADEAIDAIIERLDEDKALQSRIGTMHGFQLTLTRHSSGTAFYVKIRGQHEFEAMVASVSSIESAMRKLAKTAAEYQQEIEDNKASMGRMADMQKEPFGQAALLDKKRTMLADLIADLARNPEPAPAWLRHGAPANTAIYVNGQQRVVEGHKSDKTGYFLVTEAGDVPYLDATDAAGMPLFSPMDGDGSEERPTLDLTGLPDSAARAVQRRSEDRLRRGDDAQPASEDNEDNSDAASAEAAPTLYRVTSPEGDVKERTLSADDIVQLRRHRWKVEPLKTKLSRGVAGPGMARAAVQQVADTIAAGWAKAPPVSVVATVAELPFKAPADTRGALHNGRVYLVAANLHSAAEAQFVLGHEALGHLGLRSIMGVPQLAAEMARLREANPALAAAAREQVRLHGYDLNLATEEALADIAGSGKQITGWQKFVAAVQQALRKLGLNSLADWVEGKTAAETMALLGRARAAVEGGQSAPADAGAVAQLSDAGGGHWYSALARQLEKSVTRSASPLHWAETIMGGSFAQQGVKQDEIQWSGVLDWLLMQKEAGVAKVTREQLLNYLAGNGVQVKETMLGDPSEEEIQLLLDDEVGEGMTREDAVDYLRADEGSTKYRQYQLPGGENYRELLLTLRDKEPSFAIDDYLDVLNAKYGTVTIGNTVYPDWTDDQLTPDELAKLRQLGADTRAEKARNPTFQSSHWKEPNVLAHIRFNERTDADGARVLFVEEIQSDWGQSGKRNGFMPTEAERQAASARAKELLAEQQQHDPSSPEWESFKDKIAEQGNIMSQRSDLPARAPFVGKTEAWLSLAVKRMIRYAAENGFDKVAFVNGAQSAERYSLEKQVKEIRVLRRDDGRYSVFATRIEDQEDGESRLTDRAGVDAKGLSDFIGKDLADKAIAALDAKYQAQQQSIALYRVESADGQQLDGHKYQLAKAQSLARSYGMQVVPAGQVKGVAEPVEQVFSGVDLKVGGEGMKAFYDQIVPNVVNDVLKKLGGGKVAPMQVGMSWEGYLQQRGISEQEANGYAELTAHGQQLHYAQVRQQYFDAHPDVEDTASQLGFAITDALRAKAQAGLPLFARTTQDAIVFSGNELGGKDQPMAQLRSKAREFARRFAGKTVTVAVDGAQIQMPWTGIRHALSGNVDFVTAVAATKLDQLIERGTLAETVPDNKGRAEVKAIHYYDTPVVIGGEQSVVRIVVREMSDGKRYYDHFENREAAADGGSENLPGNEPGPSSLQPASEANSSIDDSGQDAGPLFSRSPADISRRIGAAIKGITVSNVRNKGVDWRGIGLQMLGRRQLAELYGKLFPQGAKPDMMASYNTLAMKMDAEKNEAGAAADQLATRWAKLPKQVGDALAELMHDATRLQIDPRKPRVLGDIKKHYDALKAAYDAVTANAEAKAIFDAAAASYEAHYAAVKLAVHERVDRAMVGNPNKAAMLAQMDAQFFGQIKGIYFPLARFGDYLVQVNWRGANPNPAMGQAREAIHFAETMAEAQQLRTELLAKYPPSAGFQVAEITRRAEYNAARDAVGRGFLQQLFNVFKATGVDPSLQDAINQLYLTSLPDLSWAKHGIHRKGTPGFSQDARRAFAHHMFHGARYLAKLHYGDQLAQDLDDMQHYVKAHAQDADYEPVKAQQVVDEMVKRHDLYMNPKSNPLSTTLTSLGFVFYLGASPASAAVNLSQTALVAYPILGARYGFGKAASALIAASKDAVQGHNDMAKVLAGDELRAYRDWIKTGLIDVSLAHDLAGVAQGNDSMLHGAVGTTMKAASFMFHHAEKFNRQATALASYRLARAKGMDHDAAFAAAVDDTYAAHFDYSAGNRPRIMQGDVARVLLLFKQYAQNMTYTFAHNAAAAFKGDRQALKTIAALLTSHALAAGVLGLPVVGILLGAASLLGGSDDEPWDAEIALRNLMAEALGQKAGEVVAHGVSRLTPWDISARVGLNSLWLPDVQEGLEGAQRAESVMTGLLGPVAAMGVNTAKGAHTIAATGSWQRGLEEMLPSAMRGPLKAWRYLNEGIKDKTGIELLPDTTVAEDVGQVLGFSPSRGREAQAGKSAVYQTDKALQRRRSQLMGEYAHHVMAQEDPSATLEAIKAFNMLHPNRLIAPLHLQHSVRLRMQHVAQAKDGIFLPPKRSDARAAGAFADETP